MIPPYFGLSDGKTTKQKRGKKDLNESDAYTGVEGARG